MADANGRGGKVSPTLAVLWRSVGPYHIARTSAAAAGLAAHGVRTIAIELCDSEETRDWQVNRADAACEVRTLAAGARLSDRSTDLTRQMLAALDELRPQWIAIAGWDRPEMRAALEWANRRQAAAILMSETKWDDRARPWWRRKVTSRLVRRADAALVSGAAAGEFLVALGFPRERIFRHYGAVDNEYFRRHAADCRSTSAPPYFLACSRLIESRKNIVQLLHAYAAYRSRTAAPWDLVICGDGPDKSSYETLVRDNKISGVTFAGFQQIESLAGYYARAACFVHPAINEAWGLVVNEALASGLPVLVSRRCGCAYDLVHEGVNGFTFDPGNVSGIAASLENMAALPQSHRAGMGAASLKIVARYGCGQFTGGLLQAMDSIAGLPAVNVPNAAEDVGSRVGRGDAGPSSEQQGAVDGSVTDLSTVAVSVQA